MFWIAWNCKKFCQTYLDPSPRTLSPTLKVEQNVWGEAFGRCICEESPFVSKAICSTSFCAQQCLSFSTLLNICKYQINLEKIWEQYENKHNNNTSLINKKIFFIICLLICFCRVVDSSVCTILTKIVLQPHLIQMRVISCYARGYNRQLMGLLPRLVTACIVTAYTEDYTSFSEAL